MLYNLGVTPQINATLSALFASKDAGITSPRASIYRDTGYYFHNLHISNSVCVKFCRMFLFRVHFN